MSKYRSGADFEREIVHYLLDKGAFVVLRGAGSKSYGSSIKCDIMALMRYTIPYKNEVVSYTVLLIQAKHSKKNQKKAKAEFESQKLMSWVRFLWLDKREDWKRKIDGAIA